MALQVENYNYTKELENKSSPQYKAIEKNFTEEVWFVFLLPSFHSLSPHSFFFLLRSSLFAFLSNPSSLLFFLPLFSLLPSSNSLLLLSFLSHLSFSLFLPSLSLPRIPFRPSFSFSLPFPFFSLLRFLSQHFTISPTLSLSSVLPPSLLFLWILSFLPTVCSYHLFYRMS